MSEYKLAKLVELLGKYAYCIGIKHMEFSKAIIWFEDEYEDTYDRNIFVEFYANCQNAGRRGGSIDLEKYARMIINSD